MANFITKSWNFIWNIKKVVLSSGYKNIIWLRINSSDDWEKKNPALNFYTLTFTSNIFLQKAEIINHPENTGKCIPSLLYFFKEIFIFLQKTIVNIKYSFLTSDVSVGISSFLTILREILK